MKPICGIASYQIRRNIISVFEFRKLRILMSHKLCVLLNLRGISGAARKNKVKTKNSRYWHDFLTVHYFEKDNPLYAWNSSIIERLVDII